MPFDKCSSVYSIASIKSSFPPHAVFMNEYVNGYLSQVSDRLHFLYLFQQKASNAEKFDYVSMKSDG